MEGEIMRAVMMGLFIAAFPLLALPGAPDGEYVVIQFETAFQNKARAVETVTLQANVNVTDTGVTALDIQQGTIVTNGSDLTVSGTVTSSVTDSKPSSS